MTIDVLSLIALSLAALTGLTSMFRWRQWLGLCRHVYDRELSVRGRISPAAVQFLAACQGRTHPSDSNAAVTSTCEGSSA